MVYDRKPLFQPEEGSIMRARITLTVLAVCLLITGSAAAEIEIHEKHRFDARPGSTVVVDVSFHSVEVTARPGGAVDVTVEITVKGDGSSAKNVANDLTPVFEEEGDRLIIRSTRKKGWNWKNVKAKGKVTVEMPPGVNLTIDSSSGSAKIAGDLGDAVVRFDASSGSLTVDGAMGELHSDTSSGSIRATVSRPLDAFTADASSGSVHLSGGARIAKADTSSGSITVSGLLGEGKFDSSSGSVKAQWESIPPGTPVRASASSGSVTLTFPAGTSVSGSLEVSSGGLHSDFPALVRGKDKLELDGGPDAIDVAVNTSSGSIKLLAN
jgi:DUF4097 and DUF4098 domain-containing protein YvlB